MPPARQQHTAERRRAGITVTVLATSLTAALSVPVASSLVLAYGTVCPSWEDEGTMAAPDSPYAQILCGDSDITFTPAIASGLSLVALLTIWAWRSTRPGHRSRPRAGLLTGIRLIALLVLPALFVTGLHFVLPQHCLTGPTSPGACARDREH